MNDQLIESIHQKIVSLEHFLKIKDDSRSGKIVFTNGCFDILHVGHIEYLAKAKELGGLLVIGLNSDASVKRLKGDQRPVNPERARATLLAALSFVDYVIVFQENTPLNLIKDLSPDYLVKGGDYKMEEIVGAEWVIKNGGEVVIIPLTDGFSTTNVIEKLQK